MKDKLKKILLSIVVSLLLITIPARPSASSISRYLVAVLFDASGFKLQYTIYDNEETKPKKLGAYAGKDHSGDYVGWDGNMDITTTNLETTVTWMLFPGTEIGKEGIATQQDYQQAEEVIGTLVNDFNAAIAFVLTNGDKSQFGSATISEFASAIANAANSGKPAYGVSFSKGGSNYTAQSFEGTAMQGTDLKEDFVTLSANNEKTVLRFAAPKGYYGSDQLLSGSGQGDKVHSKLNWFHLAKFATYASEVGLYADNDGWEEFYDQGLLEQPLKELTKTIQKSISASRLGFYDLETLVLNRGQKEYGYYLGMMPTTWYTVSNALFWIFEILGVFILFASILYMIYKQNHAVISPRDKLAVQDHIADVLIAIFLMVLYPVVFYIMGKTNQMIVSLLNEMTGGETLTNAMSYNWIVGLIMVVVNLIIMIKINITYLTRAITITVLHVISPAVIASISITGKGKGSIFSTWLKEMIGAIFLQSFDAIIVTIFIIICSAWKGGAWWETALMTFMLIPLNTWFKQTFLQTAGISKIAGEAFSSAEKPALTIGKQAAGMAVGAVSGITSGISNVKKFKADTELTEQKNKDVIDFAKGGEDNSNKNTEGARKDGDANVNMNTGAPSAKESVNENKKQSPSTTTETQTVVTTPTVTDSDRASTETTAPATDTSNTVLDAEYSPSVAAQKSKEKEKIWSAEKAKSVGAWNAFFVGMTGGKGIIGKAAKNRLDRANASIAYHNPLSGMYGRHLTQSPDSLKSKLQAAGMIAPDPVSNNSKGGDSSNESAGGPPRDDGEAVLDQDQTTPEVETPVDNSKPKNTSSLIDDALDGENSQTIDYNEPEVDIPDRKKPKKDDVYSEENNFTGEDFNPDDKK